MKENIPMTELLKRWEIGKVLSVKKIYYTGEVFLVTTVQGNKYILKEKKEKQKVYCEYKLISALKTYGLPVAVPKCDKRGNFCFENEGKYYCLYPFLKGNTVVHYYTKDAEEQIKSFGTAVARLHKGLRQYRPTDEYPCLNLNEELFEKSLPRIRQNSDAENTKMIDRIADELKENLEIRSKKLPQQLIHKDMHPSNMLYESGKGVVGIVDFESVETGYRLYDICYFCAYILIGGFKDIEKRSKWFRLVQVFLRSYNSVSRITKDETDAFWYILLSTLFFFAGVFYSVCNTGTAKKTQDAIYWVYEKKEDILEFLN